MRQIQVIEPSIFQSNAKKRVCAYARVSSDSLDQKNSFSSQVNYYTKHIQTHPDWTFVDIYADEGITGTSAEKRDEFLRLMRDCRQGKVDVILVKSVSRFARNAQDCISAVRELRNLGVTVSFEKEHIRTDNMTNEMLLSMMSAFAQEESISISQNMRKGAVMRMKNGTFNLSQAPYGYRLNEDKKLVLDEIQARVVKRIYSDFLSGMSIREIANALQQEKVPKLYNEPVWSYTGVYYILTNERYIGDQLFQKQYTTDTLPFKKKINRGEKDQYYISDTHEPIIEQSIFEKAQELLNEKKLKHGQRKSITTYIFTSKIECAECHSIFCRRIDKKGVVRWVCSKHFRDKTSCSMQGMLQTDIEEYFLKLCYKLSHNRENILEIFLSRVEMIRDKDYVGNAGTMALNKQIADLLEQNHTLHRLRAKECVDSAFFQSQTNVLSQKVSALRKQLQSYQDTNDYYDIIQGTRRILKLIGQGKSEFNAMVFSEIVNKITVTEKNVIFHLCNGLSLEEQRGNIQK